VVKLHHDLEEQVHHNSQLMVDNGARQVEIRAREEELAVIRAEVARVNKVGAWVGGFGCCASVSACAAYRCGRS